MNAREQIVRVLEEVLDWTKTNRQVFNQIRGMNPWPVAHTLLNGQRFKVYEAELCEGNGCRRHDCSSFSPNFR